MSDRCSSKPLESKLSEDTSTSPKPVALCPLSRPIHNISLLRGNSIHIGYDSKSPSHKWAPSDRLRLIHFLQDIQLDRALDVLPDNYTYEDLLKCTLEELRVVLIGCLTDSEISSLYSDLHSYASIRYATEPYSRFEEHQDRRCSETCPSDQVRQISANAQRHSRPLGSFSCASYSSCSKSKLHPLSLATSGEKFSTNCSVSKINVEEPCKAVKRASSLGSGDISQTLPNYRPSSLSISSALTDSHSLSLQEDGGTNSTEFQGPYLTHASLSNSELCKDSRLRSICDDQSKNYSTENSASQDPCVIQKQNTHTNTCSVTSSVLYSVPFCRQVNNELQLSPYFSSHLSSYDGHSIPGTLLRIKGSFIGQSAPNLLYYMRGPNYNEFLHCRNSYLNVSSACTPPSNLKSPGLLINSKASENHKCNENVRHSQFSTNQSLLVSASKGLKGINETAQTITSLPFHTQRRSMLVSGLGSLSGSSGCMADRSMSSPTPSNEPDSPVFLATSLAHNDMTFFLSPKNSIVTCEPVQLTKSSNLAGEDSQTEILCTHLDSSQQHDKVVPQLINSQTNCKVFENKYTDTLALQEQYDLSSFTEKRSFVPRLHLGSKHTTDCRRWSLASLPSSGYGTNTSESGSHLSRSRCSSRENVSHAPHVQTSTHPTGRAISARSKYQTSVQTPNKCLPIELSYSLLSPSIPTYSRVPNSASPLSFSSSVGQNEVSPNLFYISRSSKESCSEEPGNDTSLLNILPSLYTSVCSTDSKSVPHTPVTRASPRIAHSSASVIQTPLNSSFTRSRSLSPLRVSNVGGEQEILLLNHVYRERFPKASAYMQEQLASLADEMEHMDIVSWSAVARFVHCQVVQHARDCLQKALSGLVTCRYFYEMTENLSKLVEDTRTRDPDSIPLVVTFIRRLLLIIARPARLLECLEFDPSEFYQMLEVAENHVRHRTNSMGLPGSQIISADVPLYIISKLGLSKTVLDDGALHSEKFKSDSAIRTRTTSGSNLSACMNTDGKIVSKTTRSNSSCVPIRPPCEADFEVIKLISNGAYGLLITHEGHIKLTDFGLSRIGLMNLATNLYEKNLDLEKDCKMFRDKQVFGTPEYIAPEVILRQGYGKPVDWWSMGIMLYEFLVGCVPFSGTTIEELFDNIVTAPIDWPEEDEWKVTPSAVDIIIRLLERDPLLRLGTIGGSSEVKETIFFSGPGAVDWKNLLRQKAAFVPQLEHDEDTSYFDPRTDRYKHDVENDEDIYIPMDYALCSNRSSPAPNSSLVRNFSFTSPADHSLTNTIRRPAASRLGRTKQQAVDRKRSHSLGDSNSLLLLPFKSRSKSRSIRDSLVHSEIGSSGSQRSLYQQKCDSEKIEHDLVTSTLTAESVASRNALHMLQNLSLTSSTTENSCSKSVGENNIHNQQTVTPPRKLEKLNIDVTKQEVHDDNLNDNQSTIDDSRTFHYFSSYSPRFSVVLEQARMNELLRNNSNTSLNSNDPDALNEKNSLRASSPRINLTSSSNFSIKCANVELPKENGKFDPSEQQSDTNMQSSISSDRSLSTSRTNINPSNVRSSNIQDIPECSKCGQFSSEIVNPSIVIPSITQTGSECATSILLNGPWLLNVDLKPEDHLNVPSYQDASRACASLKSASPLPCHSGGISFTQSDMYSCHALSSSDQFPPRSLLFRDNLSQVIHLPVSPLGSNSPSIRPFLSHSPGIPHQAIIINKGKQGFGFVFRAIRVFFGLSDAYTLHHLVLGVVPHGPAAKAGLKEADLILSVNDISTIGMYHTDVVKLILQSGTTLRLHATPISQTFIRSDGPYRSSGRLVPRVTSSGHLAKNYLSLSNNCTSGYSNLFPDKHTCTSYTQFNPLMSSHSNSTEVPKDISPLPFITKTYASVCASNNSRQADEVARHINRRLTIREARHRHLNNGAYESKVQYIQPDASSKYCFQHSDSVPNNTYMDRSRSCYSQSATSSKGGSSQTYASVAAQRFGISLGQTCSNSLYSNSVSQNNMFFPGHRRSLEKPLIRQLSERQHRAMFSTLDDTSSPNSPLVFSPRNTVPYSSPYQSLKSDHFQKQNVFSFHRPSVTVTSSFSGSSLSSSGWCSGGDLSSHSSPGSGNSSAPSIPRPGDSSHSSLNPFQQTRFSSARASSQSAAQCIHSHVDNSSVKLTFPRQQAPKSTFITQNSDGSQCRHSDPIRPARDIRTVCSVVPNQQIVNNFSTSITNPSLNLPLPPHNPVQNMDPDKFSLQANALVSSGQVKLRRHSHRFAVQHVTSPKSPAESSDEKCKNY
ncbi:Microtubule-associated serine/threonine-protein kinase 2 [Schistosoma japonicum]|nr:Microtubule-associated serine/threonine-protein kinase 2 [Schistosoma japonicum]